MVESGHRWVTCVQCIAPGVQTVHLCASIVTNGLQLLQLEVFGSWLDNKILAGSLINSHNLRLMHSAANLVEFCKV